MFLFIDDYFELRFKLTVVFSLTLARGNNYFEHENKKFTTWVTRMKFLNLSTRQ